MSFGFTCKFYSCKNIPNSSQEKMQSIIEAVSVSYSPNRFDHPVLTFFMAKIGLSCVLNDALLFLTQGWRSSNCAWSIKWAQSLWKFNKSSFGFLEFRLCKCVLCIVKLVLSCVLSKNSHSWSVVQNTRWHWISFQSLNWIIAQLEFVLCKWQISCKNCL